MSEGGPGSLRVLQLITRLNVGGPAKHVAWLMTGLPPERFTQKLVTGSLPPGEDDMGPWCREIGVEFTVLPELGRQVSPLDDLRALAGVFRLLWRFAPHVVATHTSKAGFLGRAALVLYRPLARLCGRPRPGAVHTFHGHTFHGYFSPLTSRVFLAAERILGRLATDRVVVISPEQLREIRDVYRVAPARRFALLPLGIDLAPFADPAPGREAFRRELGLPAGAWLVGAVGRISPIKNYGLFLTAAARARELSPDLASRLHVALIGGGPPEQVAALQSQARDLGLAPVLHLLGNRDDPARFFPGLDALALTSRNEGTPMAILEGGAVGLPVLATAVGGVPDLLGPEEGEAASGVTRRERGLTTAAGEAEALARGLVWLAEHPGAARDLGAALAAEVRRAYSRERLAADTAALYEKVAGRGR
ncbi:MAG: glycosyltransferase [Deltaproteobacteria bacterium]|nr:glycosyltransferase [Deltaproteobacteria bacterium]